MPPKTDQPPLRLELNHSKRLVKLMGLLHALALVACVMNSLPALIKSALFIAVFTHGYFELKRLRAKHYWLEHTETGWQLAEGHSFVDIQILPSTVISMIAIFLHFKSADKPVKTLLIPSDALATDDYRHLIVRLKTTVCNEKNTE